uniref:Down syndrome cell adhesion molecule n=1 Tax=Tetranychus urticae TaxID=32264 RepID=T1KQ15_TETUR
MNLLITSWILLIPNCYANQINYNHQQLDKFTNESGLKVDQQSQPNGFKVVNKRSYSLYGSNNKQIQERLKSPSRYPPTFLRTFDEAVLEEGASLSLNCVAYGNPLPQVTWLLDGYPVLDISRYRIGDYVTKDGRLVSYVNITSVLAQDGGLYECTASNDVDTVRHSRRINILGPPFIRPMKNISGVAEESLIINCPIGGYPIETIFWERENIRLPYNHRQKVLANGTLIINDVERATDQGKYTCGARNKEGVEAKGSFYVSVLVRPFIDPFNFSSNLQSGQRYNALCSVTRGDPPIEIRWLKDGRPITGVSSSSMDSNPSSSPHPLGIDIIQVKDFSSHLTFESLGPEHRGNYTCIATNSAGSDLHNASMIIHVPPRWHIEPRDTAVIKDQLAIIDCQADGFPVPQTHWSRAEEPSTNFKPINSSPHLRVFENGSLAIHNAQKSDAGYYLCQTSNNIGSGLSKVIKLTVHVAAHFETKFNVHTVRKGQEARVQCKAIGDKPITINWLKDKISFNPRDDVRYELFEEASSEGLISEILIRSADRRDSALFTCNTFNGFGKDETNVQLLLQEPPDAPQDVKISDHDGRSATITWSPPYPGNSPIMEYIVQYKLEKEKWTASRGFWNGSAPGGATLYKLKNLHPVTHYQLRMFATNAIGRSEASQIIHFRTDEEAPGGPPLHIKAIPISSSSIRVTWKPPKKELTFGVIKGYYVGYKVAKDTDEAGGQRAVNGEGEGSKVEGSPNGASYTYKTLEAKDRSSNEEAHITGLTRATKYFVTVQAFNSKGSGPASEEVLVQTLEKDPPVSPNLKVNSKTSYSITISWSIDQQAQTDPPTGYIIHMKRSNSDKWESIEVSASQTSHTFEGLSCGTSYQFYIIAFNEIGKSDPSNIIYVKTEGLAPVAPDKHSLLSINSTNAVIHLDSWHDGGCPMNKIEIMYKEEKRSDWLSLPFIFPSPSSSSVPSSSSSSSATLSSSRDEKDILLNNLRPATNYDLKITATNEAGPIQAAYSFKTSFKANRGHSLIGNEASKSSADHSLYLDMNLLLPTTITIGVTFIILTFLVCLIFLKKRQNNISFYENPGIYDSGKCEPVNESVRLTQLDAGSMKKSTGDAASALDSGYFPSPYAMTKIENEKNEVNGVLQMETKRPINSPIKKHSTSESGEPLYATVKRTPRPPRSDVHVYHYPMTQATSDSGCNSEASWQNMVTPSQSSHEATINSATLVRFHEGPSEKGLSSTPMTSMYSVYTDRQPMLMCQSSQRFNGSYSRGSIS